MLAKIKVANPNLKVDYNNNYELSFPVDNVSKFAVKQLMNAVQQNKKTLQISVDYVTKERTLNQNRLMWGLLQEFAFHQNGGRKGGGNEEELYYKALAKHGISQFLMVEDCALETLQQAYKHVTKIDKFTSNGKVYWQCKCLLGSSRYTTAQMADLIDGILDDMAEAGINSPTMNALEEEWRSYYTRENGVAYGNGK